MTLHALAAAVADLKAQFADMKKRLRLATRAPLSYRAVITTQGTTGSPSVITINRVGVGPDVVRVRLCNNGTYANSSNATMAPTQGSATVETHTSNKDLSIKEVQAVAASGVLTLTGVVIDAQKVTVGDRVYEFDARTSAHVDAGSVRVDISASATKATRVLTMDTQPTAGDTFTIGSKVFTLVPTGTATAEGEVALSADLAATKLNVVAAINGTDSVNTAHTQVTASAFSTHDCTLTAIVGGTAANSIATTETFTAGTNVFAGATLTGGTDCSAANAITALVSAITGDASADVTAADGTGDTVDPTAITAGAAGNAIATTETLTNGSFGSATLTGGIDAAPGVFKVAVTDAVAETITIRTGQPLVGSSGADHREALQLTHAA